MLMEVVMGNLENYPYREIGSRRTDWSLEALPYCEQHIKHRCDASANPFLRSICNGTIVDRTS